MTTLERVELAALAGADYREQWLTSRHALRVLLGLLGLPRDTTAYGFPHPRLSLAHASNGAIAVGTVGPWAAGLGIDYETDRPVDPRTARFFLSEAELAWLAQVPYADRAAQQLRLWTVKEAVFKADLANRDALLSDYSVCDYSPQPADEGTAGWASRRGAGQLFGYTSTRFKGGHLSVAAAHSTAAASTDPDSDPDSDPDPVDRRSSLPVTFEVVAERISETLNVPVAELAQETLLRDLTADSFMLVEMAVDLREEFDDVFTQAEPREVSNLGQLADLLHGPCRSSPSCRAG
jgi:acyl carrier protein